MVGSAPLGSARCERATPLDPPGASGPLRWIRLGARWTGFVSYVIASGAEANPTQGRSPKGGAPDPTNFAPDPTDTPRNGALDPRNFAPDSTSAPLGWAPSGSYASASITEARRAGTSRHECRHFPTRGPRPSLKAGAHSDMNAGSLHDSLVPTVRNVGTKHPGRDLTIGAGRGRARSQGTGPSARGPRNWSPRGGSPRSWRRGLAAPPSGRALSASGAEATA